MCVLSVRMPAGSVCGGQEDKKGRRDGWQEG